MADALSQSGVRTYLYFMDYYHLVGEPTVSARHPEAGKAVHHSSASYCTLCITTHHSLATNLRCGIALTVCRQGIAWGALVVTVRRQAVAGCGKWFTVCRQAKNHQNIPCTLFGEMRFSLIPGRIYFALHKSNEKYP